jgi:hypothetical protein
MIRNGLFEKTYTDIRYRIALHLLFWLLMLASYYYFNTISFNPARGTPATYLLAMHNAISIATAFYTLMYVIWPRAIARKRWALSLLLLFVWLVAIAALVSYGDWLIFSRCESCGQRLAQYSPDYYKFLQRNFPNIVFVRVVTGGLLYQLITQLSLPIAIKIGRSYFRQTVQGLQLAKDNLQLEFNFLKAQVNPHFLFNTLNNIYSLVVNERKEQAATTIERLSGFLRYTLYETADEKITLDKEVQLLKDYMELEKLRLNETDMQFHYESDSDGYTVPPLLFMPALENAFKYTEDKAGARIAVNIQAKQQQLQVCIQNDSAHGKASKTGGIGLQNLQKRLQHYYPGTSSYSATETNGVYLFRLSCTLA